MSPIADATVAVKQASSPDRLIDNESLDIGGQTVYRQRVQDPEVIALLESVKTAVEGTITAVISGDLNLSAATLAALETINAVVVGAVSVTGTVALDATSLSALETVSLDAATLAALENITATISGAVALDSATLAALESISATVINTVTVTGTVELGATSLAALESITVAVSNFPSDYPDAGTVAVLATILTELQQKLEPGGLIDLGATTLAALETISAVVSATDFDIRPLTLTEDSVRNTFRVMTAFSATRTGPLTADVLVAVAVGDRIRILKNMGHCDPEVADGVYPIVTMKIGSVVIYTDKLESGLPWNETVCFEGAPGEDLTLDLTTSSAVYLNVRYEIF